jgi:hypothetical protein
MNYTPTTAEITALRRRVGEFPAETSEYSDEELTAVLTDRNGDQHAAAYDVWSWKAAAAASLMDWSADGGDYKQAALYDRYKANAEEEKAQSALLSGFLLDPTLKPVEE